MTLAQSSSDRSAISGFVDDDMFSFNRANWLNQRQCLCIDGGTGGEVCRLQLHLVISRLAVAVREPVVFRRVDVHEIGLATLTTSLSMPRSRTSSVKAQFCDRLTRLPAVVNFSVGMF